MIKFYDCVKSPGLGTADLVTFTEEIVNGKLHFLCSVVTLDVIFWHLQYLVEQYLATFPKN